MNEFQRSIDSVFTSFLQHSADAGEVNDEEQGHNYSSSLSRKCLNSLDNMMRNFGDRCKFFALFSMVPVFVAVILIIPILVCVKVDGILSGSESALAQADWMVLLSPLFVFEILNFLGNLSIGAIVPAMRCGSVLALEILLALKWDGSVDYKYSVILIPLYIHQILLLVSDDNFFGLDSFILRVIFLVLLTLQLDQDRGWNWNIVLIPIWIEVLLGQLGACCYNLEKTEIEKPVTLPYTFIVITLALFSVKLNEATDGDENNGFSCLWILFPLFFIAFLFLVISMCVIFYAEYGEAEDDSGIVSDNLRARKDKAKKEEEEEVKFPIALDKKEEEKTDLEANNDALVISAGVDEAKKDEEEVKFPIALDKEEEKSNLEASNDALVISAGVDEVEKDEEEVKSPNALDKAEEEKSDLEANSKVNMDDRN